MLSPIKTFPQDRGGSTQRPESLTIWIMGTSNLAKLGTLGDLERLSPEVCDNLRSLYVVHQLLITDKLEPVLRAIIPNLACGETPDEHI